MLCALGPDQDYLVSGLGFDQQSQGFLFISYLCIAFCFWNEICVLDPNVHMSALICCCWGRFLSGPQVSPGICVNLYVPSLCQATKRSLMTLCPGLKKKRDTKEPNATNGERGGSQIINYNPCPRAAEERKESNGIRWFWKSVSLEELSLGVRNRREDILLCILLFLGTFVLTTSLFPFLSA